MGLLDGLVGAWLTSESSAAAGCIDSFDSGNNMTPSGSMAVGGGIGSNTLGTGPNVGSRIFAGAQSQRLTDRTSVSMGHGQSFTVACWCLFSQRTTPMAVVSKWGDSFPSYEYLLYFNNGANRMEFYCGDSTPASAAVQATNYGAVVDWTWMHIVAGWDTGNIFIRIDNGTANMAAFTNGAYNGLSDLRFGMMHNSGGAAELYGYLSKVHIWKRKLEDAEVADLYNYQLAWPFTLGEVPAGGVGRRSSKQYGAQGVVYA